MDALIRLVDAIDRWPIRTLLLVNSVLGGIVALANGSAMILTLSGKAPELSTNLSYMVMLTAGAATVLLLGLAARVFPQMLALTLRTHGLLLLALACQTLWEGVDVVVNGPPEGVNFRWDGGLVIALVTYSVYFARRGLLTTSQLARPLFRFCHIGAAVTALVVSALVFGRMTSHGT